MLRAAIEILESRKHERYENTKNTEGLVHRFEDLSGKVIGAALAVHRELGPGFLESAYHAAMKVSLVHRSVPFMSQVPVDIRFEGVKVGQARLDLVVAGQLVLELKAVDVLHDIHFAQLRSYQRAAKLRLGLLLNFNAPTLVIRRIVLD